MTEVEAAQEEVPQPEAGAEPTAEQQEAGGEDAEANGSNHKRKFEEEGGEEAAEEEGEPMRKRASFNGPEEGDGNGGEAQEGQEVGEPTPAAAPAGGEGAPEGAPEETAPAAAPAAAGADGGNPPQEGGDPSGEVTEVQEVPGNLVGRLIGRGGETIKSIQDKSGASVQVDHSGPEEGKRVTVKGSREAVDKALAEIQSCLSPDTNETVDCPPGIVGRIIGRQGETIKSLQVASEAHIVVDQNYPEGVDRKIIVSGRPDSVERAVHMIKELIKGEPGGAQQIIQKFGVGITDHVECAKGMVGRVIGKGGETIKALQRTHGVNIQVDQTGDPTRVQVSGPTSNVHRCMSQIRDIISGGPAGANFGLGGPGGPPGGGPPGYGGAPGGGYGGGYGGFPAPGGYAPYGGFPAPGGYGGYGAAAGGYGAAAPAAAYGGYGGAAGGAYGAYGAYGAGAAAADPYAAAGGGYGGAAGGYGGQAAAAAAPAAATGAVGASRGSGLWQELQDEQGRSYYYNTQTGASQWEKPDDF